MARKTYRLTDQTFKAIAGHEIAIADEMQCDPSYIYQIKNQQSPDPYPKFRELYRATVRKGGGYQHWDNDMAAIRAAEIKDTTAETLHLLLRKISTDAASTERLVKALDDGVLTESEIHEILKDVAAVEDNCRELKQGLYQRLGELSVEKERKL